LEPVFARRDGYRRLYFDLPGMGQTPRSERVATSDQMLDLVEQVIQRLVGDEPYLVVGESYGGYLARGLVHRNPARVLGLLLICPMIVADRALRRLPSHQVLASDPAVLAGLTPEERQEFESIAVVINERTWRRFREDIMDGLKLADAGYLEGIRQGGFAYSFDPDALPQPFNRPALILTGRQDASTGYQDAWHLLDAYPHATFAVLDRAGHNLQIEQEGLFVTLVEEWLDRCAGQAQPS
jgi:pimeloyl-ACP methyl ester carboxylesterase